MDEETERLLFPLKKYASKKQIIDERYKRTCEILKIEYVDELYINFSLIEIAIGTNNIESDLVHIAKEVCDDIILMYKKTVAWIPMQTWNVNFDIRNKENSKVMFFTSQRALDDIDLFYKMLNKKPPVVRKDVQLLK